MKKYICKVPLKYRNTININKIDYKQGYKLKIDRKCLYLISLQINKMSFKSEETVTINILSNEDEDLIYLEFDALYADSKNDAVQILQELLDKLLPSLTFKLNCLNDNKHAVQYKLTYDIIQTEWKEVNYKKFEEYLKTVNGGNTFRDFLNMEDKVSMQVLHNVKVDNYDIVFNSYNRNPFIKQIIDCYTRAMGDTDYISKYFNLFTIIEALETYYRKSVDEKLLTDNEIKSLLDYMRNASLEFKESPINDNIIKRIEDTLNRITTKPRGKKLLTIFNDLLRINRIDVLGNKIEINSKFVSRIIKQRNTLFHAKKLDDNELDQLRTLVIYLFILCEQIINNLINELD